MNPNSQNQTWSKWTFTVIAPHAIRPFSEVVENCRRFGRKAFGEASAMQVSEDKDVYRIEVITEKHPVQDLAYVANMRQQWNTFFIAGFGASSWTTLETKLLAGNPENGRPPDQWVGLPCIPVTTAMGWNER